MAETLTDISRWLQSPAYQQAVERIARENNTASQNYGRNFVHMASPLPPGHAHKTDYSVFKNSPEEKNKKITAKMNHRESLQRAYGREWKKHLNTPGRTMPTIKLQF